MHDDVLSFVLDGLEKYLELERELGVKSIEFDRTLLAEEPKAKPSAPSRPVATPIHQTSPASATPPATAPRTASATSAARVCPFAFVHDKPLSPKAVEMMAKIIVALKATSESAPIAVAPPLPHAKTYIFLGRRALQKYLPATVVQENAWFLTPKGKAALLVKSPEEIVRFSTVTPAVKRMKEEMWRALKTIAQHL